MREVLRQRGPLRNRELDGRAVEYYRAGKDTGVALYFLWLTGELMTHSRQGRERVYDFLQNIAPPDLQWTASEEQAIEHFIRKGISHLGLVSERDVRNLLKNATGHAISAAEAKTRLADLAAAGQVSAVHLEGQRSSLYHLAEDTPLLEMLGNGETPDAWQPLVATTGEEVIFLSPLDYTSARGRAKDLFDFDYIWEIYKPAAQRVYGPYTLPILYGDRLVARMDARLDRQSQTLFVNGFWLEAWFEPDDAFAVALARGLHSLAHFLGAERLDITPLDPDFLRAQAGEYLSSHGIPPV